MTTSDTKRIYVVNNGQPFIWTQEEVVYQDGKIQKDSDNVEIKDVLKGNCSLGEKTIYMIGGDVKVSEVINRKSEAEIEKMGLDTLSDEEKESMYISYSTDYDFPLEVNRDYAVILSNSDIPTIMGNGYGIFENKNNVNGLNTLSTNSFTNVLTGKALDI